VLLKSKDSDRKIMFGSRDETVLRKWWDAMHLAMYATLTLLRRYVLSFSAVEVYVSLLLHSSIAPVVFTRATLC